MRIESGLSGYSYQNRYVHNVTDGEEVAAETAISSKPQTASSPAFSSTLLSPSLATALWTIEGGRKGVSPAPPRLPTAVPRRSCRRPRRSRHSIANTNCRKIRRA